MQRRYLHTNIPTEIVRTIVVIAEAGSFSKAGERLGLSQPAISAQVKRLQMMVGGVMFEKVTGGVTFTPKGKTVLAYARKLLDANDQILSLGGAISDFQPTRLGLSSLFVKKFFETWRQGDAAVPISYICDHSAELAKSFEYGHLDIACLINPPPAIGSVAFEWREDYVWVRSRDFVLGHGNPIPLICWPGSLADELMINALEKAGLAYRVVFTSADHHSRITAVGAGVGLMGLPGRMVNDPLMIAKEYYLPPLAPSRAGILLRAGADPESVAPIFKVLKTLSPQNNPAQPAA
jgi:DNA-binding transcriptional LysR family regulator